MEIVWVKDKDNKKMYINRKYNGKYEDERYDIGYFDESSNERRTFYTKNYDKVKLDIGKPNFNLLYDNKWLATHPNGMLDVTPPLGESIETLGSYAVDEEHKYYTAWHVGMIYLTARYDIVNVPMKLYHKDVLVTVHFKQSIYTPSAWLKEKDLYELEYDTMEIIPSTYKSLLSTPPGKLLGVVSMSIRVKDRILTACSKIPGIRVRRNARIEVIGYSTGETFGEVVSTRVEGMIKLEQGYFILNKHLFAVTNEAISGDSGGGCYLIS